MTRPALAFRIARLFGEPIEAIFDDGELKQAAQVERSSSCSSPARMELETLPGVRGSN